MELASNADAAGTSLKIGVLTDLSGFYADIGGPGAVDAVRMAVEDFGGSVLGRPIEVIAGDTLNKPDVASAIPHSRGRGASPPVPLPRAGRTRTEAAGRYRLLSGAV